MVNRRSDDTFRGARSLQLNRTEKNLIGQSDRVDFYKFTASSQVDFSLSLSGLRANVNVKLLDGRRIPIATSNRPGNQPEQISATLERGTHYIQVQIAGRRGNTRYNLLASTAPAEPGEILSTARDIGVLKRMQQISISSLLTIMPICRLELTVPLQEQGLNSFAMAMVMD